MILAHARRGQEKGPKGREAQATFKTSESNNNRHINTPTPNSITTKTIQIDQEDDGIELIGAAAGKEEMIVEPRTTLTKGCTRV